VSRPAPSAQPPAHRRLEGRIVIATHNSGKLRELRELLSPHGIEAVSAGELALPEPEESGTSYALDGAPGIHSARWAGENKDFARAMQKIENLLRETNATDRRAHFVSALCVAWPDGHVEEFEGRVDGTVVWPPRGTAGFGYDPVFLPDGHTRTFGEMNAEEKHGLPPKGKGLSHRARAFLKLASVCLQPIADD
jgi:XTP/dITP diphosphohydrolase